MKFLNSGGQFCLEISFIKNKVDFWVGRSVFKINRFAPKQISPPTIKMDQMANKSMA